MPVRGWKERLTERTHHSLRMPPGAKGTPPSSFSIIPQPPPSAPSFSLQISPGHSPNPHLPATKGIITIFILSGLSADLSLQPIHE